jgi:hypothetical protein
MNGDSLVDYAFDVWNSSDDAGRWTLSDIIPTSEEDDCYFRARRHFVDWFTNFVYDSPDPLDTYANGIPFADARRIACLADVFFGAVECSLEAADDFRRTWTSLPR